LEPDNPKARLHLPRRILTAYTVLIAGLLATIVVSTYLNKSFLPYTLTAGVTISLLLFVLAHLQTRARHAAEIFASKLQISESTVRNMLAERERAEKALKESEERYRDLVENANDIVYTMDLNGNLTSINKAAELITGFKRTDLLTKNLGAFITPESMETTRQMLKRKLLGEERTNYEMDLRSIDGRTLTLEISSKLMLKDGKPLGIQGIARDITSRRRAEETLRQADQRALSTYERLLERVSSLAQTFGTARDLAAIFRALREFTFMSVPCQGLFVSLYDPARDVRTACYGWADGVELDTSQLPPMPVTSSGPNSRAVRTNQVVITTDYMNETRGHPALLVGPDNGLRPQSSLSAPMSVMGRVIGTIEVQTYDQDAYGEEHATAMRLAANLAAVAIENVRLLERESTARAAAEESNRLKDEFLATVSHELRTPLTAILGWSRMLEGGLETEMAKRAIETIKRNAKAQAQIIDDILDVSRIITGNLYLELHPIELASVLEAAVNVVRPTAEAKGIQIEFNFEREPTVISGDAHRLQQVFWNLLSNAVKFTAPGGKVNLSLRQLAAEVEIEITDTGKGIDPEFLPFVFDRFRQADSTSTRQHGGLGLGLAIARHLVEIHGGHISAASEGEGQGASFRLRLPLIGSLAKSNAQPNGDEQISETQPPQDVLAGIEVLVVDDDRDTLELLTAALKQRSAIVTAVSSAAAAMDSIMASQPHVLISDIAMPGEDGYDLIRKVIALELAPKISAIAITAYAKEEDRERALSAGYQRYLAKPVELGEFILAVAEAGHKQIIALEKLKFSKS
jgi:PAS domain S-box-containing protein